MKILINGTATVDPFGLHWLKRNIPINETIDLSAAEAGHWFPVFGEKFMVGLFLETAGDTEYADIKVAVYHIPIFDQKGPLVSHIQNGPQHVHVGKGQYVFDGTVQVLA